MFSLLGRQFLAFTLSFCIIINPLLASGIEINDISDIQPYHSLRPYQENRYALTLDKDLWNLTPEKKVILEIKNKPIAVIFRQEKQNTLIFQALDNSRFHFLKGENQKITHGATLFYAPDGHLSFHGGNLESTIIQSKSLYLNNTFHKEEKSPLLIQGDFTVKSDQLKNKGLTQSNGKTVFDVKNWKNNKNVIFKTDNEFEFKGKIHNDGKIATYKAMTLKGTFTQGEEGICFAGISILGNFDTLKAKGKFIAPLINLSSSEYLILSGTHFQAVQLLLKTAGEMAFKKNAFKTRDLIYIEAKKSLKGDGTFLVANSNSYKFPFHVFYENMNPKDKLSGKLLKQLTNYIEKHPLQNKLIGFHCLSEGAVTFSPQSQFDILIGETSFKSTYADIASHIYTGSYNQHGVSINAKEIDFSGVLESLSSHFNSEKGEISGKLKVEDLLLTGNIFNLKGNSTGENLTAIGQDLIIQKEGSAHYLNANLNLKTFVVDGKASFGQAQIISNQSLISESGTLTISHLNNNCPSWKNFGTTHIHNFQSQTPNLCLENLSIDRANIQANQATLTGVKLDYLTLLSTCLTASKTKGNHWNISAITTNLEDTMIHNLFMQGDSLRTNHSTIFNLDGSLRSVANLEGGSISQMSLRTPLFTASNTRGNHWHVEANQTTLSNTSIDYFSLKGKNLNADNSSGHLWSLDLDSANFSGSTNTSLTGRVADFCNNGVIHGSLDLMGNTFINRGIIQGDTCNLDYKTYLALGYFNVRGLSLTLNDLLINENLLTYFERTHSFQSLNLRTNQPLRFQKNFYFGRSLGLSAPSISFSPPLFWHPLFKVGGSLHLDSRNVPLNVKNFNIHAGEDLVFTGAGANLYRSTFSAGRDVIGDLQGKFTGTAFHVIGQKISLAANEINTHAIETIKSETTTRTSGFLNQCTHRYTDTWSEIERNSLSGDEVDIISRGSVKLDSTNFTSRKTTIYALDSVTNLDRIGFHETTSKSGGFFGWFPSSSRQYEQFSAPTVFTSTDTITVRSHQDGIHMPSTVFLTLRHLNLWAKKKIYLAPPTLRREFSFKSSGITVDNFFLNPYMPDPLVSSIQNVFEKQGINQVSAAVQAGIQLRNTYWDYKNAKNPKEFLKGRATDALTSLFNVKIGFQTTTIESSETFQGDGGIYAGSADIYSGEGDIIFGNGLPVHIQNRLKITAPKGDWIRDGFEGKKTFEFSQANMGVTVNPFTGLQGVHMSGSETSSESNYWIPQVTQAGELITDVRSIRIQEPVPIYSVTRKSSFGFSASPSGAMSLNVNGYGFSYAPSNEEKNHWGGVGIMVNGNEFYAPLPSKNMTKPDYSYAPFKSPQAKMDANERSALRSEPKSILFEKTPPQKESPQKPTVYRPGFKVKSREYPVTQESTSTSPILKSRETVLEEVINTLPKSEAPQKDNTILRHSAQFEKDGPMPSFLPHSPNPQPSKKLERPEKSRKTTLGSFALASIPFGLDSTSTRYWYFGRYSKVLNLVSTEKHSGTYSLGDILQTDNGYYVVKGHGSPYSMELNNEDLKKDFRPSQISNIFPDVTFYLNPSSLAQLMYENGYQGEDVVLTGCNVAAGEGTYPQELADTLDRKVLAFTGMVTTWRENPFHKLYCQQDPEELEKYNITPHEGPCQLKTFYPSGYKESISDKLTNAGLDVPFLKQYLVEPTVERFNYAKERIFGVGRGLRNIGFQILSMGEMVWDAAILYAGNDSERRELLLDPSGLSQAPRLKDTETYRNSSTRMGERIELVKDLAVVTLSAPSWKVDQLYTSGILKGQRPWETEGYKTSRRNIDVKIVAPLYMLYNNYINASGPEKAGKEVEFITTLFGPGVLLRGAKGLSGKEKPTPLRISDDLHFPATITEDVYSWIPDPIEKRIRLKKDFLEPNDKLKILPLIVGQDQLGVYIGRIESNYKVKNSNLLFKTTKNIENIARQEKKSTLVVEAQITNLKILDLLQRLNNKNIIQFYYQETFHRSMFEKESLFSVLRKKIFPHESQKEMLFKNAHFYPIAPTNNASYNVKIIKEVKPLEIDTRSSLPQKPSSQVKNKVSEPKKTPVPDILLPVATELIQKEKSISPQILNDHHFPATITKDIYSWNSDPIEKRIRLKKDFLEPGDMLDTGLLALGKDHLGGYIGEIVAKQKNSHLLFKTIKKIQKLAHQKNKSLIIFEAFVENPKLLEVLQKWNNQNKIQLYYYDTSYLVPKKEVRFKNAHDYPYPFKNFASGVEVKIIQKVKPLEIDNRPSLLQKPSSRSKNKLIPFAPSLDTRTYFFNAKFSDIKLFGNHIPDAEKIAPPKPHMRNMFVDTVSDSGTVPDSGYAIAQLFVENVKQKMDSSWRHHSQAPFFLLVKEKEGIPYVWHNNGTQWKEIEITHREATNFVQKNFKGREVVILAGPYVNEKFSGFVQNLSNSLNKSVYFESSFELVPYRRPNSISNFTVDKPFTKYTPKPFKDSTVKKTSQGHTPTLQERRNLYNLSKAEKSINKLQKARKELGSERFNEIVCNFTDESPLFSAGDLILSSKLKKVKQDTPPLLTQDQIDKFLEATPIKKTPKDVVPFVEDYTQTRWTTATYGKIKLLEDIEWGQETSFQMGIQKMTRSWEHNSKGKIVFFSHGDFNGVEYSYLFTPGGFKGLGKKTSPIRKDFDLTHRSLVKIIKQTGLSPTQEVILLACQGGGFDFAQNVANKLNAIVYAPSPLHIIGLGDNLLKTIPIHPTVPQQGLMKYIPGKNIKKETSSLQKQKINKVDSSDENLILLREKTPKPLKPNKAPRIVNSVRSQSVIWKSLLKTNFQRLKMNHARTEFYFWDDLHNEIEVFSKRGHHKGAIDPTSGEKIKPADPKKRLKL